MPIVNFPKGQGRTTIRAKHQLQHQIRALIPLIGYTQRDFALLGTSSYS